MYFVVKNKVVKNTVVARKATHFLEQYLSAIHQAINPGTAARTT
jgi:hypothetical protein